MKVSSTTSRWSVKGRLGHRKAERLFKAASKSIEVYQREKKAFALN